MVVKIGRIVEETCFKMTVGIGSRLHCLLGGECKRLAISLIDARGNYDKIRSKRGWDEVAYVKD